jgi:enoyl-CoA hydratase/carnithine racemase
VAATAGALAPDVVVALIGAGTMGSGIAAVAAAAGHQVLLYDALPGAADAGVARQLVLTGEPNSAAEAFAAGLVSEVVEDGKALDRALELARSVCSMPPLAVRATKEVMRLGEDAPLEAALALEGQAFVLLCDSQDQKDGMRAFLETRRPAFQGR